MTVRARESDLTLQDVEAWGTEIGTLREGDWFTAVVAGPDGLGWIVATGEIRAVCLGCVIIKIDGEKDVWTWAHEAKVIKLDKSQFKSKSEENTIMATQTQAQAATAAATPKAASLQTRFDFWTRKSNAAMETGDGEALEAAMKAIENVEAEAQAAGVELLTGGTGAETPTPAPAPVPAKDKVKGAKVPPSVAGKDAVAAKAAKVAAAKANAPIPGATKSPKKAKAAKAMHPCLDGCGAQVVGNFAMGHDAKLKSLILKIERGEEDPGAIPSVAQDLVKFKNGEKVTEKDAKGKTTGTTQLKICTAAPVRFKGREAAMTLTARP